MNECPNGCNTNKIPFSSAELEILKTVVPTQKEREELDRAAVLLVKAADESGEASGMVTGSIARNTWLSGDKDIDVFMLFDPDITKEELQEKGLSLARSITEKYGGEYVEKYAEHPYLSAKIMGFEVDLVPCCNVKSAEHIKSAVDRTPFHTRFMKDRIAPFTDDVRLLKLFMKACGVYGSDHMTGGFAGYLCEILILHYGGFRECLAAASKWHQGIIIDVCHHKAKDFTDPLTVIDPVDSKRNVAASLTSERMYEFSEYAREYLKNPSAEFFTSVRPHTLSHGEFISVLKDRGTVLYAVTFKTPGEIPDNVVPQLRKSASAVQALLERYGFTVNRSSSCMKPDKSMLLFELLTDNLPKVEKRFGPPVWEAENGAKFVEKHLNTALSGPYIKDGRYIAETARKYPCARGLLESHEFAGCGLGKDVIRTIKKEYAVFDGEDCYSDEFADFLSGFFGYRTPLCRLKIKKLSE